LTNIINWLQKSENKQANNVVYRALNEFDETVVRLFILLASPYMIVKYAYTILSIVSNTNVIKYNHFYQRGSVDYVQQCWEGFEMVHELYNIDKN
jgi:hypothetical protein